MLLHPKGIHCVPLITNAEVKRGAPLKTEAVSVFPLLHLVVHEKDVTLSNLTLVCIISHLEVRLVI